MGAAEGIGRVRRSERVWGPALLALCALLCLAGAEAALRGLAPETDGLYVWPPELRATFRPEPGVMPGVSGTSHFSVNAWGIRGDAFRAGQRYRILAIGGSTTESLYLDDAEAWPYLLQQALNARLDGSPVWVGNVGKSGLNTRHHVFQVRELLPRYPRIDAVLLLVGINDLARRLALDGDWRPLSQEPPEVVERIFQRAFSVLPRPHARFAPREIARRLGALRARLLDSGDAGGTRQDAAGSAYPRWRAHRRDAAAIRSELPDLGPALEEYAHNVSASIEFARRAGARVILATQPTLWRPDLPAALRELLWMGGVGDFQREAGHEYYGVAALAAGMARYNRALLEICARTGAACVDLDSALARDTTVFYDDCHFNENGAREVAALLADYLLRSDALQASLRRDVAASSGVRPEPRRR